MGNHGKQYRDLLQRAERFNGHRWDDEDRALTEYWDSLRQHTDAKPDDRRGNLWGIAAAVLWGAAVVCALVLAVLM